MSGPYITQTARSVPLDNSTDGIVADNVQEAIEEVRFALDVISFSMLILPTRQYIVVDQLEITAAGDVDVEGSLAVL